MLSIVENTLIRLQVEHLPGDRDAQPMWLWWSGTSADAPDVDRIWQAYLRRLDLEHTFRMFKQALGWTKLKLRHPRAADRWTRIMIAAHTPLRLAWPIALHLRRSWERPAPPEWLTPARVPGWVSEPTPDIGSTSGSTELVASRPPNGPTGLKNHSRTTRYDVGKAVRRETLLGGPPRREPQARGFKEQA